MNQLKNERDGKDKKLNYWEFKRKENIYFFIKNNYYEINNVN